MTYDGTDPDDDGVVESDVDNQSTTTETLDTDDATINNSATISGPLSLAGSLNGDNLIIESQTTTVDGSSATEIYDLPNRNTGILFVQHPSSGGSQFADIVLSGAGSSPEPTVVSSYDRATAPTRNYTVTFDGLVSLQIGSGSLDVNVVAIAHDR